MWFDPKEHNQVRWLLRLELFGVKYEKVINKRNGFRFKLSNGFC